MQQVFFCPNPPKFWAGKEKKNSEKTLFPEYTFTGRSECVPFVVLLEYIFCYYYNNDKDMGVEV